MVRKPKVGSGAAGGSGPLPGTAEAAVDAAFAQSFEAAPTAPAAPQDPPGDQADRIAAAAVDLAGLQGWRGLSLAAVAGAADVTLADIARHFGSRPEILDGFERMIDRLMLAAATDSADKPRDRLFGLVMARFDALLPHRDGVRRIARELPLDPLSGLVLTAALPRSIAWMYAGAAIRIEGPTMPLQLAALTAAYLATFRIWINEDSADLPKTMAALDRNLDRIQRIFPSDAKPAPEQTAPPAPDAEADIV